MNNRLIILFLLAAIASNTHAEPNGCGTGWNRYLVPNSVPLAACQFKVSCDQHDICYGKCGDLPADKRPPQCEYLRCRPEGDLFRKQECGDVKFVELKKDADGRKRQCDAVFYTNIVNNNPEKPVCRAFAVIYRNAVQYFGGGAFAGIDGRVVGGLSRTQEERSRAAIDSLLTQLSSSELTEFSDALEKGDVQIDWRREVFFSKEKRLHNQ